MCLVEVENARSLVASCAMPIANGMSIYTNTARVIKAREAVLEFLLINHPLDCPICDQGGECDLQDITLAYGSDKSRFYEVKKRSVVNKNVGVFVKTVMNRCIHCTRCVRFFKDVLNVDNFGILGRGSNSEIGTYVQNNLNTVFSGNVVDLCPVGALTSNEFAFKNRHWELSSFEYVNIFDNFLGLLKFDVYGDKVVRTLPLDVNKFSWITNVSRYAYEMYNFGRVYHYFLKDFNTNTYLKVSDYVAFKFLFKVFAYKFFFGIISFFFNTNSFNTNVLNISYLKKAINSLGLVSSYESFSGICFDFLDKHIFEFFDIKSNSMILCFGLSIRMIFPAYSLSLLSKLKKNQVEMLSWGYDDYNSLFFNGLVNYNYLGNSFLDFNYFLKGKGFIFNNLIKGGVFLDSFLFVDSSIYKQLGSRIDFLVNNLGFILYVYMEIFSFNYVENMIFDYNKLEDVTVLSSLTYINDNGYKGNNSGLVINETSFFNMVEGNVNLVLPEYLLYEKNFLMRSLSGDVKFSEYFLKNSVELNSFHLSWVNKISVLLKNKIVNSLFFISFLGDFVLFKIYVKMVKTLNNVLIKSIEGNLRIKGVYNSLFFEYYGQNKLLLNIRVLSIGCRNSLKKGFFNKEF